MPPPDRLRGMTPEKPVDAAPAARPRKPGLGRLRDPARAALGPPREELARHRIEAKHGRSLEARPRTPKVAASGAPGGASSHAWDEETPRKRLIGRSRRPLTGVSQAPAFPGAPLPSRGA